jgi:hypothetical protein
MVDRVPDVDVLKEDAAAYFDRTDALVVYLRRLTPAQCEAFFNDADIFHAFEMMLNFQERFTLLMERRSQSEYSPDQQKVEMEGILADNIAAVLACSERVRRLAQTGGEANAA